MPEQSKHPSGNELKQMLIRHEGLALTPYRDTVGKLTIGVGHNLDDNGIEKEVAMFILQLDVADITAQLYAHLPWAADLNIPRQDALIDMAFNLGVGGLKKFRKMLAALELNDWQTAHDEMLNSKWAGQVGGRAEELADIILTGSMEEAPHGR